MTRAAVLAVVLALAPAPARAAPTHATVVLLAAPAADDLVGELRSAIEGAKADPDGGRETLRTVLERFDAEPSAVAASNDAHAVRIEGLLTLAKAELAQDREAEAIAAIDKAIRIARGEPLPVTGYGARVAKLHDLRVSAPELRPAGSVHVTCSVQCRVILDGRNAGEGTDVMVTGIPLGGHQLRVEPIAPDIDHHFQTDVLLSNGEPERAFEYTVPTADAPKDAPAKTATAKKRRLPRWAGIVGIGAGAALTIAGAVLIAMDGKCPDGSDPMSADPCPDVLNTDAVGIALTSVGAATLVGFSIALGIGEARQKKAGAALTIRF